MSRFFVRSSWIRATAAKRQDQGIRVVDEADRGSLGGNGTIDRVPPHVGVKCQATCWCERTVVNLTWDEVYRGETRSCGRKGCAPPDEPTTHTC